VSEAYHQYLQNLSWWEQIDRFFNPGKYSCSTYYSDNIAYPLFLAFIIVAVGCIIVLILMRRINHNNSIVYKNKTGFNDPKVDDVVKLDFHFEGYHSELAKELAEFIKKNNLSVGKQDTEK
jgi:hypothetical protein